MFVSVFFSVFLASGRSSTESHLNHRFDQLVGSAFDNPGFRPRLFQSRRFLQADVSGTGFESWQEGNGIIPAGVDIEGIVQPNQPDSAVLRLFRSPHTLASLSPISGFPP